MRSVDEVFRPILPEPNLVSESPQGYSQSLTVGPQFESQTNLTQTFLRPDCCDDRSRCENEEKERRRKKKKKENSYTYRDINKGPSCLRHRPSCLSPPCLLLFLHLDRVSDSPARFCYITESTDENVFSVNNPPHQFFMVRTKEVAEEKIN